MPRKPKYYVRKDGLSEAIRIIDGKRVAFRGHGDREVEKKLREYREKVKNGRTFDIVAEEWKEIHFPVLSPNTLRGYQPAFKRARDHFKDKYIREIVPKEVQSYINGLPKTWALKTATTQLQIFNMIFNHAVMEGDIEVNPCSSVAVPPGLRKTRRDAATPEIEAKVKASYKTWLLPYLILYTGLRKGEALALQYGDIIRDAKEIIVNKSVCYIKNRPTIKAPKTEKGNRTVPILYPLEGKIPKGKADHYIFSLDGGKTPLTEMQYQKLWKQYEESVKIKVSAHQLRHSFATMLFESDIDPQDAMDILGHAQLSTTREIYTHIRESRRKVIADRLNEKLKGTQDNTESTQGKA